MNDPRADKRSAASIYGKWSSILAFVIVYLLDGAKRRHSMVVLIGIMIVIVFFFLGDIRILITIEAFPSNLFSPGLPSWTVVLEVLFGFIINSVTHERFVDVAGLLRENMMK